MHIANRPQSMGRLPRFPADWGIGEQGLNFGMGETDMGKGAGNVSIIGGADGPTSIFIAGKGGKVKLTTRIQNYFRKIKRSRIKRRITVNPHTLEEVVDLLKREYGAVEVSQKSHNYQEQRKNLKASLIMRHRPDLLGELMDLELPEGEDMESFRANQPTEFGSAVTDYERKGILPVFYGQT